MRLHTLFLLPMGCVLLVLATPSTGGAEPHHGPQAFDHAPIGVMGDHTHHTGEVMPSYRYMRMRMEGNRDGRDRLSTSDVLASYPVAPTNMDMDMHMFGAMYAPHERVTLMVMIPLVSLSMDHVTGMGARFRTESKGIGDVSVGALVPLFERDIHSVHMGFSVITPTGSIDEVDGTPMGQEMILPYPMQLGSGSWSLAPQFTYNGRAERWAWGAQVGAKFRLNRNDASYKLGDEAEVTTWLAREVTRWASLSARLDFLHRGNIDGFDPRLNPAVVPTADPDRRGGERLDMGVGLNLVAPSGPLSGVRLALEVLFPLVQSLDGPQLETDWNVVTGIQYAF